ncbi:MAG: hypothetical protein ACREVW_01090 [Burkholderiales bacterium]
MTPELYRDRHAHALIVFEHLGARVRALKIGPPVRVARYERRDLTPLLYRGQPYPLRRALRHFQDARRTFGITDTARDVLRQLRKGTP